MIKYCGLILIFLSGSPLFACGPWFPSAYLNGENFFQEPRIDLHAELELIAKHFYPELAAVNYPRIKITKEQAIKNDFLTACRTGGIGESSAKALLNRMLAGLKTASAGQYSPLFQPYPQLREFDLYASGIAEMTLDPNKLPPSWQELMLLPPEQRRYRTAWTLYMMGNMYVSRVPEFAAICYGELQKYVRNGGYDSMGLAYASFHSEYVYSYNQSRKNPTEWIKSLLRCVAANRDPKDYDSGIATSYLQDFFQKKYNFRYFKKQEMMNDAAVREVVLLFEAEKNFYSFPVETAAMLKNRKLVCADHLAWLAYRSGKYEDCLLFLEMVPNDSLIKIWLQAKFARRHGDFKTSAKLLHRWFEIFDKEKNEGQLRFHDNPYEPQNSVIKFSTVVKGELGYTQVFNSDFSEALYTFMKAESWVDGSCVAEQLVPLNDLIEFCKNHCPQEKNSKFSDKLRHLLARRLIRNHRFDEALKWFPAEHRKIAEEYVRMFREGNDIKKTRNERAIVFYNLGKHVFNHGEELMSTEQAPDFYITNGYFEFGGLHNTWYKSPKNIIEPIPDFYHRQDTFPTLRGHYRYKAVEYWTRAATLTDNNNVRVASLYESFIFLKYRNPDKANDYYMMLCDCRPHPLAQRAWKDNWKFQCNDMQLNKGWNNYTASEADFAELFKIDNNYKPDEITTEKQP